MTSDSGSALRIIFAGTPDFAAEALAALIKSEHQIVAVYSQPDRPAGRGRKLKASPVKQLALDNNIPVEQPLSLKSDEEQAKLATYQADIMVVAAYGLILPKTILETPRLGCLNIHASLLPRWRGAAPIQRAILAGDTETGITIMQMDEGLDTGAMLLKKSCPIETTDNAQSLHDRLATLGAEAILAALDTLATLNAEQQDSAQASYAKKLDKAEALIDWQLSAQEIDRQIRAFNPWPVAQTHIDDKTLRIWMASVLPGDHNAEPGTIIQTSSEGIDVACGEAQLRITQAQLPGARAMSVTDLVNGHGEFFSPGKQLK
ncbi:MAG: methionyl-tRNA formyltransferase [Gammaproteobacteria bacterium]|nr:methionyl-tRNA formyltransferase [Gammaproteobacteria bacterium]